MSNSEHKADGTLLSPYRVLDLTDEKGFMCGKILADLGADVLKIERPGGDSDRSIGPFYHDIPDIEKSLNWFALNANKRGITLNIETSVGQDIFKKLVNKADFVIESFEPGYLNNLGIGYESLSSINERIILTSITPFGQEGPYSHYAGSDLVCTAMGGMQYICGYPDRPPVRIGDSFAYANAGAQAATGMMIAHFYRQMTGIGQYIDISITEGLPELMVSYLHFWEYQREVVERAGDSRAIVKTTGTPHKYHFKTKDGYVCYAVFGGKTGAKSNRKLTEWMDSEGMADDFLNNFNWEEFDMVTESQEIIHAIYKSLELFFLSHTTMELKEGAFSRKIMLYPVQNTKDIVEDIHLQSRSFMVEVEHHELNEIIKYPGPFAKLSASPMNIYRRAPLIGEHNQEIYLEELGFTKEQMVQMQNNGII